jgi:F0F1-type ATP synthase membrane subunit b/b'
MDDSTRLLLNPVIQYGFAGLCVILLGILVWLVKQLLGVIDRNNEVIATNTLAIQAVDANAKEAKDVTIELKDELYRRPCIARLNVGGG